MQRNLSVTTLLKYNQLEFVLHYSGAAFWKNENCLLIADVHLGKVAHFRKNGLAVPAAVGLVNFELLEEVLSFFNPKSVIYLGDLFHSKTNNDWKAFSAFIEKNFKQKHVLIAGNHDIISESHYKKLGIAVVSEIETNELLLTHHPTETDSKLNICGHIHPGILLRGTGRQSLRLPCFFKSKNQLILPAFGVFTGKYILEPKAEDKVFAIAERQVFDVSDYFQNQI